MAQASLKGAAYIKVTLLERFKRNSVLYSFSDTDNHIDETSRGPVD